MAVLDIYRRHQATFGLSVYKIDNMVNMICNALLQDIMKTKPMTHIGNPLITVHI